MKSLSTILTQGIAVLASLSSSAQPPPQHLAGKLDGYGGYKFGMTLKEAMAVRGDVKVTNCEYTGVEKCLERQGRFFGEPGNVTVQIFKSTGRVEQIVIAFRRMDSPEDSQACKKTVDVLLPQLLKVYDPKQAVSPNTQRELVWYFSKGGEVSLVNLCITDDLGMVVVTYKATDGF